MNVKKILIDYFSFSLIHVLKKFEIPKDGCIHVGANMGTELETYEEYGFKNTIWVEGYTPFYDVLFEKIKGKKNQYAFNIMVSDVSGEPVDFKVASNTGSSTIFEPTDSWYETFSDLKFEKTESIKCKRIDETLREKFDEEFLKSMKFLVLDIEGAELKALRSMGTLLSNVQYILVEVSLRANFHGAPLLCDIDKFLYQNSFKRIYSKFGAASGDGLYVKVKKNYAHDLMWVYTKDFVIQASSSLRITDGLIKIKKLVKTAFFK